MGRALAFICTCGVGLAKHFVVRQGRFWTGQAKPDVVLLNLFESRSCSIVAAQNGGMYSEIARNEMTRLNVFVLRMKVYTNFY